MGKGDIKTRKGKIANGSYGVKRPQDPPKVEIKPKSEKIKKEKPEKPKAKAKK